MRSDLKSARAARMQKPGACNVRALESLQPRETREGRGQADEVLRGPRREVLRGPSRYLPVQKTERDASEGEMGAHSAHPEILARQGIVGLS